MKRFGGFIREESSQNARSRRRLWTITLLANVALFSAIAVVAAISVPGLLIEEPEPEGSLGGEGDGAVAQPADHDEGAVGGWADPFRLVQVRWKSRRTR